MENLKTCLKSLLVCFLITLLYSCGGNTVNTTEPVVEPMPPTTPPTETFDFLVDIVKIVDVQSIDATNQLVNYGFNNIAVKAKYDIELYRINYRSTYKSEPIIASGLVAIPKGITEPIPLLSLQHGTILKTTFAPTASHNDGEYALAWLLASVGYLVVIPDYFGFGSAVDIFHPYIVDESSANSVVDMIKAGKEFAKVQNMSLSDKLFLVGFSEGGYVTGSALRKVENDPTLNATAAVLGAPAIDVNAVLHHFVSQGRHEFPTFGLYILYAYRQHYAFPNPFSDFVLEPYASNMDDLFDGTKALTQVNNQISMDVNEVLALEFRMDILSKNKENVMLKRLEENSWHTFLPQTPVKIYHGTEDTYIHYGGSESYVQSVNNQGVDHVTLTAIPGADHAGAFVVYWYSAIEWFETLR